MPIVRGRSFLACALPLIGLIASCSTDSLHSNPGLLSASSTVIDFGTQSVGSSTQRALFLLNNGSRTVTLSQPQGDTLGGTFSVVLQKTSAAVHGDALVSIVFQPLAVMAYQTSFTFPNDSQNEPNLKVTIKGAGIVGDSCAGVTCNTPPGAVCTDATTSRHYDPAGTCSAGKCSYNPIDQACPNGCDAASGFCSGDPCIGMACNTPPPPACIDANTSRTFNPAGTCSNGQCSYAPIDSPCQYGCDSLAGTCIPDPCQGVTCDQPPNGCFQPQGKCVNGGCVYTAAAGVPCNDGNGCTVNDTCHQGICYGTPKACNSPPPSVCKTDGVTLVTYSPDGTCDPTSGVCSYGDFQTASCAHGCANGACMSDPCAGGCDDGNPCTIDTCDQAGCHHSYADGNACNTGSGDCPNGTCSSGICQVDESQTCVAQIQTDLCGETDVPGICASNGQCIVQQPPQQFTCPECGADILCIQCTPFPGLQLHLCL